MSTVISTAMTPENPVTPQTAIRAAADSLAAAGESRPRAARDPVNLPMIRNWIEAIDPAGADSAGPDDPDTAPPAMIQVWTMPGLHGARAEGRQRQSRLACRAAAIATRLIDGQARVHAWRIPEHYDENWQPLPDYNLHDRSDQFRPDGTTPGHSFEWARLLLTLDAAQTTPPPGCSKRRPRSSTPRSPMRGSGTVTRD